MFQIQEQLFCLFQKEYFIDSIKHAARPPPQRHRFHFQHLFFLPLRNQTSPVVCTDKPLGRSNMCSRIHPLTRTQSSNASNYLSSTEYSTIYRKEKIDRNVQTIPFNVCFFSDIFVGFSKVFSQTTTQ